MTTQQTYSEQSLLPGKKLLLMRALWWGTLSLVLGTWLGAFLNDYSAYLARDLTQAEVSLLENMALAWRDIVTYISFNKAASMAVYLIIAILIYWRRPREWHTILISATLILIGAATSWVFPTLDNSNPVLFQLAILIDALGWIAFGLMFYIFPDGRLIPKWTLWLLLVGSIYMIIRTLTRNLGVGLLEENAYDLVFFMPIIIIGIYSQSYRYIHISSQKQRQQTKWVIYGFVMTALLLMLASVIELFLLDVVNPNTNLEGFYRIFLYDLHYRLAYIVLPLTIGAAILQYRLFDIDVIIRRTLVYSTLTIFLIVVYFAAVVGFQSLFTTLTGQQSALAIVLSTLIIAALFTPARNRLQQIIDRRFYRARYNAQQSLSRFTTTAQDEVDVDQLKDELINVVQETLQPEVITMWLNK